MYLNNLGAAMHDYYRRTKRQKDLDDAIQT